MKNTYKPIYRIIFMQLVNESFRSRLLETEKQRLLSIMNYFLEEIDLQEEQFQGRPRTPMKDILKCLIVMNYHGWSLRRAHSDIVQLYQLGFISCIPKRATLGKYLLEERTQEILEKLIVLSALPLADLNETLITDSTWYQKFINTCIAHKNKVRKIDLASHYKTRKLHVGMFKETKIICWAKGSGGHEHDSIFFEKMLTETIANGFRVKTLIADKGYVSKNSYALCQEYGIKECFIQMKDFYTGKRPGSQLWRDQLKKFKEKPEEWNEVYRYRSLIESLFSSWKRKHRNFIRNRISTSQNCELLLIALWHNLTILSKFYNQEFMDSL